MNRLRLHVTFREVVHHPVLKFMDVGEMTRGQHLALQRREDDLHLIQPGGVDRQPVDTHLEGKLQRPNPAPDLLGRMGGTIVQDQMQDTDALDPEAMENHLEERLEIHESLTRQATGDRLSRVDEQPREQMQHSLAHVAGSMAYRLARLGGIDSAGCQPGLHAGLFVGTDDDLSPSRKSLGSRIEVQRDRGFFEKFRVGRLLPRVPLPRLDLVCSQPVPDGRGGNA